jgi:hypothetical protein
MNYRKFNQHLAGSLYVILCAPLGIRNSTTGRASVVASEITFCARLRLYSGPAHVLSEAF